MKNGARSEKGSILNVHYFNSFFFEKLVREGYQKARLAKWTKKVCSPPNSLLNVSLTAIHLEVRPVLERRRFDSYQPWQLTLDGGRNKLPPPPNRIVRQHGGEATGCLRRRSYYIAVLLHLIVLTHY